MQNFTNRKKRKLFFCSLYQCCFLEKKYTRIIYLEYLGQKNIKTIKVSTSFKNKISDRRSSIIFVTKIYSLSFTEKNGKNTKIFVVKVVNAVAVDLRRTSSGSAKWSRLSAPRSLRSRRTTSPRICHRLKRREICQRPDVKTDLKKIRQNYFTNKLQQVFVQRTTNSGRHLIR